MQQDLDNSSTLLADYNKKQAEKKTENGDDISDDITRLAKAIEKLVKENKSQEKDKKTPDSSNNQDKLLGVAKQTEINILENNESLGVLDKNLDRLAVISEKIENHVAETSKILRNEFDTSIEEKREDAMYRKQMLKATQKGNCDGDSSVIRKGGKDGGGFFSKLKNFVIGSLALKELADRFKLTKVISGITKIAVLKPMVAGIILALPIAVTTIVALAVAATIAAYAQEISDKLDEIFPNAMGKRQRKELQDRTEKPTPAKAAVQKHQREKEEYERREADPSYDKMKKELTGKEKKKPTDYYKPSHLIEMLENDKAYQDYYLKDIGKTLEEIKEQDRNQWEKTPKNKDDISDVEKRIFGDNISFLNSNMDELIDVQLTKTASLAPMNYNDTPARLSEVKYKEENEKILEMNNSKSFIRNMKNSETDITKMEGSISIDKFVGDLLFGGAANEGGSGGGGGSGSGASGGQSGVYDPDAIKDLYGSDRDKNVAFLEAMTKGESAAGDAGYNQMFGGSTKHKLTEMTIGEVRKLQAQGASRKGSSAAGKFQIMGFNMQHLMDDLGYTNDTIFSKEVQQNMAMHLLNKQTGGLKQYNASGKTDKDKTELLNDLSRVWAGIAPDGMSHSRYKFKGKWQPAGVKNKEAYAYIDDFTNAQVGTQMSNLDTPKMSYGGGRPQLLPQDRSKASINSINGLNQRSKDVETQEKIDEAKAKAKENTDQRNNIVSVVNNNNSGGGGVIDTVGIWDEDITFRRFAESMYG